MAVCTLLHQYAFAQSKPKFLLVDEQLLIKSKQLFIQGDKEALSKINGIISRVDSASKKGAYSVVLFKSKVAPSKDKHD
jgi:hypothetical protein